MRSRSLSSSASSASYLIGCLLAAAVAPVVNAQTSVTGAAMALKSNGSSQTLLTSGYVGTYLVVPAGGATVNFTLNATGQAATPSHLNIAIADSKFGFSVNNSSATDYTSPNVALPAGTYFVRNERDYSGNVGLTGSFTVNSLAVNTVTGNVATFSNSGTDANALAAANTYISNFRKGPGAVALTGPGNIKLLPGTPVNVDMSRNAFNFGGTVSGTGPSTGDSKNMLNPNPAVGTEANQFQQFINQYFNTIVPSNAGKWAYNEATQNNVNMTLVDQQLNYAQSHNMRARMHNLIWGSGASGGNQQPTWVNTLISQASTGSLTAKTNLRNAISSRINYYIGTTGNRSQKFIEVDGLNEAQHNPSYWNIYNPSTGVGSFNLASVYNDVAAAAAAAGNPNLRVMLNEYNVLQFSPASINSSGTQSGSDLYANWYKNQNEAIRNAGGAISGIGMQEYTNLTSTGSNAHSAATIEKAIQNLAVEGVPLSMTEFGLASGTSATDRNTLGPAALDSAMRMFYGNPQGSTFMIWGWWDTSGNTPVAQMIVTTPGNPTYTLTPFGQEWVDLTNEFSTHTTANVDASGNIAFNGFYGDYNIGNQSGFQNLTLAKGTTNYALNLATPPTWSIWNPANSGNWSTAGNWSTGGVADADGQTAYFASAGAARNITVDSPRTLGMLAFNSVNSYTLGGSSTITLAGFNVAGGNVAAIYVAAGNHTIDAPVELADDTTVTVGPLGSTLTISNLQASSATLTKAGAGNLVINKADLSNFVITGGAVTIIAGRSAASTSHVNSLSISGAGSALDLNDQDLAINYSGGSPLAAIQSLIASGYNGGAWNGDGIRSSSAASSPSGAPTALGYGEIGGSTLLIRYTYAGDATLDGTVDTTDFNVLASNFGAGTNVSWDQADFNYDGAIDSLDFNLLASNFGKTLPGAGAPLGALIPEPTSSLLLIASLIGLRRRRGCQSRRTLR